MRPTAPRASVNRVGALLRTLSHLRREQLLGQLRRALTGSGRPRGARGPEPELALARPVAPFLPPAAHVSSSLAVRPELIARAVDCPEWIDWEIEAEGPLWAYHLHQMEWLRAPGVAPEERLALGLDWIERHRRGTGWHGGPISLRSFHWLKLLATPGALPPAPEARARWLASLADQLATLAARPERHLLGNHYLWNRLAVVAGGLALDGSEADAWLGQADLLRAELAEQVHPDGSHQERSPMYHALLLENLLDTLNLLRASRRAAPEGLEEGLVDVAARMLGALRVWTHPDGEIALFADSALDIAARPGELDAYAASLGVAAQGPPREGYLPEGGYARLAAGGFSLLASLAGPAPPHQPGHAHCDALAFELVWAGQRVVADTGVFEYRPGQRRSESRATRSHATVEVGGREQAELWAAHRIGGRPRVEVVEVVPGLRAEALCAGWATPEVVHRRRFEVSDRGVRLHDRVDGPPVSLRLQLPLAVGVECSLDGRAARLVVPEAGELHVELPDGVRWRLESAPCFPSFGREASRSVLVGEARGPGRFAWNLRAGPRA